MAAYLFGYGKAGACEERDISDAASYWYRWIPMRIPIAKLELTAKAKPIYLSTSRSN